MKRDAILNEIKTFMSKINLQRGKLTVENRKSRDLREIRPGSPHRGAPNAGGVG